MSKVTRIEKALMGLDGGAFQRLVNDLLHKEGRRNIHPVGSVLGTDKPRKGTPDTFVATPNQRYILIESTTRQDTDPIGKLSEDLEKALDVHKTGIPVEAIQRVVLCHAAQVRPEEYKRLVDVANGRVLVDVFSVGRIAADIAHRFPTIAADHLGITLDTGQILTPREFVERYDQNELAAPLSTEFVARSDELDRVLSQLEKQRVVLLFGDPGVGKTRLALEVARRYRERHPNTRQLFFRSQGQDLYDDLQAYTEGHSRLLLVLDDANRVSRFEYIVELLQRRREDNLRVLATVRSYARLPIEREAAKTGHTSSIEVHPLDRKALTQLLKDSFNIHNIHYLERILDLSQGNPRLAIMAALIAKKHETLDSIRDASDLYEIYFRQVLDDIGILTSPDLLRVAGITAFLRTVDSSNEDLMAALEDTFGVGKETYWELVRTLHELELVDLYDDEIARISDQALSTYLFYRAFFRERFLRVESLLTFFPALRDRIADALTPSFAAFDSELIARRLRPAVTHRVDLLIQNGEGDQALELLIFFGELLPERCLQYFRTRTQALRKRVPVSLDSVSWEFPEAQREPPDLLRLAAALSGSALGIRREIVDYLLEWACRRPEDVPWVLKILVERYGFRTTSELEGYRSQTMLVELLAERTHEGSDIFYSRFFVAVAKYLLRTRFEENTLRGLTVQLTRFGLSPTSEVKALRTLLWETLFHIFEKQPLTRPATEALLGDLFWDLQESDLELAKLDASFLWPFMERHFEPSLFGHADLVHELSARLERNDLDPPYDLRAKFTSSAYSLSRLLLDDGARQRDLGVTVYDETKAKEISAFAAGLDTLALPRLIRDCAEIAAGLSDHKRWQFDRWIPILFDAVGEHDEMLFKQLIERYLESGNNFRIHPRKVVRRLIDVCGREDAAETISREQESWWTRLYRLLRRLLLSRSRATPASRRRAKWWFAFYYELPSEDLSEADFRQVLFLLKESQPQDLDLDWAGLLCFEHVVGRPLPKVVRCLLDRKKEEPQLRLFHGLLWPRGDVQRRLFDLFEGADLALLEEVYLAECGFDDHLDPRGEILQEILSRDPCFLFTLFEAGIEAGGTWRASSSRTFDFLWSDGFDADLLEELMTLFVRQEEQSFVARGPLELLLATERSSELSDQVIERQDEFLHSMIRKHSDSEAWLTVVFKGLDSAPVARILSALRVLLQVNDDAALFEQLPLEPQTSASYGSAVPMLEGRIEFWTSVLELLSSPHLEGHRWYVLRAIEWYRKRVENEKKLDFLRDP